MFTFCLSLPLVFRPFSVCLTGECVERLPVWLLLLSAILAPNLQRAEEKSSIPRRFFLSQIQPSNIPAGGTLGLDTSRTDFVLQSAGVDLITFPLLCSHSRVTSENSAGTQCILLRGKFSLSQDEVKEL